MNNSLMNEVLEYMENSTSSFHAVLEAEKMLVSRGFELLAMDEPWSIKSGGSYYLIPYASSIIAFTVGKNFMQEGIRIIASHTDSPCFRVKPQPEMQTENYLMLNVEVYGGPILNTWMDRLLSMAGKVALRSDNPFKPKVAFVDFKKALMTIPNLAIHMNREVNKGVELNPQKDMLPLITQIKDGLEKDGLLMSLIAQELNVKEEDILDFDLFVYLAEKPQLVGLHNEFVSASRLDNKLMVYSSVKALIDSQKEYGLNIVVAFDNEEVGSRTKQGADSMLFNMFLDRLADTMGVTKSNYYKALSDAFMMSADAGHALHPNIPEKNDLTNKPLLNEGILIKLSANQSYVTDCETTAVIQELCRKQNISCQKFVNRSNIRGGQTLGPIASAYLPIKAVDIGLPMLAMHSARELVGSKDVEDMLKLMKQFFSEN